MINLELKSIENYVLFQEKRIKQLMKENTELKEEIRNLKGERKSNYEVKQEGNKGWTKSKVSR